MRPAILKHGHELRLGALDGLDGCTQRLELAFVCALEGLIQNLKVADGRMQPLKLPEDLLSQIRLHGRVGGWDRNAQDWCQLAAGQTLKMRV